MPTTSKRLLRRLARPSGGYEWINWKKKRNLKKEREILFLIVKFLATLPHFLSPWSFWFSAFFGLVELHKVSSNILFCSFSFLSRICPDRDSLVKDAVDLASQISKKSPIAMSGIKHNLNYSRDHSTKEGLEYMVSFLRMLFECSFISFEKRSVWANASERELLLRGTDFALSLLRRVELLETREFREKMNNSQV